jgi:hypothetical protein
MELCCRQPSLLVTINRGTVLESSVVFDGHLQADAVQKYLLALS